jgi:hypothetical protein
MPASYESDSTPVIFGISYSYQLTPIKIIKWCYHKSFFSSRSAISITKPHISDEINQLKREGLHETKHRFMLACHHREFCHSSWGKA